MEQGEKIAALRKKNGMTQAELGAALNITYQAVSKWERGESYPNFDTISQIAKLFGVPLSYFEKDYDGEPPEAEDAEEETEEYEEYEEEADEQEEPERVMLGICTACGNVVYEGEAAQTSPKLICLKCREREKSVAKARETAERQRREREELARVNAHAAVIAGTKRKRNRGFIAAAIVTALVMIIGFVSAAYGSSPGESVGGTFILALFAFTFTSQMIWGGTVRNVCLEGGVIIGTPGVIFTLDLDGVIFLIAMKILFAVLRMIVYIIFMLFFVLVAFIISPFTFIPGLIKLNRGIDTDD